MMRPRCPDVGRASRNIPTSQLLSAASVLRAVYSTTLAAGSTGTPGPPGAGAPGPRTLHHYEPASVRLLGSTLPNPEASSSGGQLPEAPSHYIGWLFDCFSAPRILPGRPASESPRRRIGGNRVPLARRTARRPPPGPAVRDPRWQRRRPYGPSLVAASWVAGRGGRPGRSAGKWNRNLPMIPLRCDAGLGRFERR
jgi:hypothetical protein